MGKERERKQEKHVYTRKDIEQMLLELGIPPDDAADGLKSDGSIRPFLNFFHAPSSGIFTPENISNIKKLIKSDVFLSVGLKLNKFKPGDLIDVIEVLTKSTPLKRFSITGESLDQSDAESCAWLLRNNPHIMHFGVSINHLTPKPFKILMKSLPSSAVTSFSWIHHGNDNNAVKIVADAFRTNNTITTFSFSSNQKISIKIFHILAEGIKHNKSITSFGFLPGTTMEKGAFEELCKLLENNQNITCIPNLLPTCYYFQKIIAYLEYNKSKYNKKVSKEAQSLKAIIEKEILLTEKDNLSKMPWLRIVIKTLDLDKDVQKELISMHGESYKYKILHIQRYAWENFLPLYGICKYDSIGQKALLVLLPLPIKGIIGRFVGLDICIEKNQTSIKGKFFNFLTSKKDAAKKGASEASSSSSVTLLGSDDSGDVDPDNE